MKKWPARKCCSVPCANAIKRRPNPKANYWQGRKQSPETNAKRSAGLKRAYAEGRHPHKIDASGLRGEETSQWRGDEAGYGAVHAWLRKYHPKSGVCEECGEAKRTTYAFKRHPERHTRNRKDYLELCYSCHNRMDDIVANLG